MPYNKRIICKGNIVSNLLLITDVARLRNVFSGLSDDKSIRLRTVNNLEKGGEEIAIEKPDLVFVQTHLSGLSAEILIMHLKKQLGRKRSRFVLLAAPNQVNEKILTPYKGWIDTSSEDDVVLADLHKLLASLTTRTIKNKKSVPPESSAIDMPEPPTVLMPDVADLQTPTEMQSQPILVEPISELVAETMPELSLEEQGITYSLRPRLTVHSDFNNSFDNAVNSAPAPEFITGVAPALKQEWNNDHLESSGFPFTKSKRSSFILWLAPVIIAVVVTTYLQQRHSSPTPNQVIKTPSTTALQAPKASQQALPANMSKASPANDNTDLHAPVTTPGTGISDKHAIPAVTDNSINKESEHSTVNVEPLTSLPGFIPRHGFDKHYSADNPGWERYKGKVTEFKVYRESRVIKAIQIIDRGDLGVPESFMKRAVKQIVKKPVFTVETTEKKDGYQVQRGHLANNLRIVYYRDAKGKKLRAFVISWQ